mmetsp:Transcript_97348/g.142489  ORF Transcript_97348/g.142489 Transcript_97348/m.142489 type:complete len:91 (-) Transcript_97348:606-878(-)
MACLCNKVYYTDTSYLCNPEERQTSTRRLRKKLNDQAVSGVAVAAVEEEEVVTDADVGCLEVKLQNLPDSLRPFPLAAWQFVHEAARLFP